MIKTHKHGGNPLADLARFDLPNKEIIDFSVNLNPVGMPEVISKNWNSLFDAVMAYPNIEGKGIVDFYTHKTGIEASEFLAGNGSTELIYLIPRALKFKNVLILTPSFNDYERASLIAGAKIKRYPLDPEKGFSFPSEEDLRTLIADVDAVWVGRPNNPTAGIFPKEIIVHLAAQYPEKYFIVDEAFIQFVDNWKEESLISEQRYPNLLVIHSFTKYYAVAGLRMGGIIGHKDTIKVLKEKKEPWSVNGVADKVALLLMDCEEYEKKTIDFLKAERERVFKALNAINGIDPFPSHSNFFLCKWCKTDNLDDLIEYLLRNGIYIRDCRNFEGLEENYFRLAIRSVEENNMLLSLLSSFEKK